MQNGNFSPQTFAKIKEHSALIQKTFAKKEQSVLISQTNIKGPGIKKISGHTFFHTSFRF